VIASKFNNPAAKLRIPDRGEMNMAHSLINVIGNVRRARSIG
jgi:hypothetical protein